ncbi:AhpC/TSA family protein [Enhygromyxa salina]|uniref:AhpC/TSA family protein n=2 Tax=Enhygromyxa salina TaxID=215803 RepID=A0A2S9YMI7_9BACT|nr:AhpC/TSA family protein [Enhygromyxa salina]
MQQRFFEKYESQGLVMVAINPDPDDYTQIPEVQAFCETLGVTYPVGVEETSTYELFTSSFDGTNPYPVDVIVDKQGIIRYVAREYDPAAMDAMIIKLLAE